MKIAARSTPSSGNSPDAASWEDNIACFLKRKPSAIIDVVAYAQIGVCRLGRCALSRLHFLPIRLASPPSTRTVVRGGKSTQAWTMQRAT